MATSILTQLLNYAGEAVPFIRDIGSRRDEVQVRMLVLVVT